MWKLCGFLVGCLTATFAWAGDAEVRAGIKKAFPKTEIESVKTSPFDKNWYEVVIGGEPFYVDSTGKYLFVGDAIELASKRNLTQERKEFLSRVDFNSLPLNSAIKRVYGNGKRTIITFEDPYCGYCKKLAQEFKQLSNITVYTFLYPVITPDSESLSKRIWCSENRNQAWMDWMNGVKPKLGNGTCKTPLEDNVKLGAKLHLQSVPVIIFSDGSVMPGYRRASDIEAKLNAINNAKKSK